MALPTADPANEPRNQPVTLDVDGEPVVVTNFRRALPEAAPAKDRVAFVRAGERKHLALDEDALHAAGRVFVDPSTVARMVDNDLLSQEVVGTAKLMVAPHFAYLTELLPLIQPRAGSAPRDVDPPRMIGNVAEGEDGGAHPDAMVVFRFRDEQQLIAQVIQTVRQTLELGKNYAPSILTKRVSRPVLAHVVRIAFDDGRSFDIVVVRDGITRVVSSWRALYPKLTAAELADKIVRSLLASKPSRRPHDTETAVRARGRDEQQKQLRGQFAEGMATGEPNERAIRIGQTLTLPVQMIVNFVVDGGGPVPVEQQFDDTVQSLVASVHGEFEPWDQSASHAAAILRALPRAVHDDAVASEVAEIAAGFRDVSEVPDVFDEDAPATALWRAVYVVAWLCNPDEYEGIKKHLRDLLDVTRITRGTYVSHLMTLVDLPWRSSKADTRIQARRAWNNGGPVPHHLLGTRWDPIPTSDFTTLVPKAMQGDSDARATLQVAGGIALVTDKLLLSNTGSALASGEVPFRANVNEIVANLGNTDAGLWLLARAANAFQADRRAANSYSEKEWLKNPPTDAYDIPDVDLDSPHEEPPRGAERVRLTPYRVVLVSDPVRAAIAEAEAEKSEAATENATEPSSEKAHRYRELLKKNIEAATSSLSSLVKLGKADPSVHPLLVDTATWQELDQAARKMSNG
jgi:hypothetical protein